MAIIGSSEQTKQIFKDLLNGKSRLKDVELKTKDKFDLVTRLRQRASGGKLPEIYAEAFAESLDPHTAFMSADTLEDFQIQMRLSLEGIGAVLSSQDGLTVIESLVPGGQVLRDALAKSIDHRAITSWAFVARFYGGEVEVC